MCLPLKCPLCGTQPTYEYQNAVNCNFSCGGGWELYDITCKQCGVRLCAATDSSADWQQLSREWIALSRYVVGYSIFSGRGDVSMRSPAWVMNAIAYNVHFWCGASEEWLDVHLGSNGSQYVRSHKDITYDFSDGDAWIHDEDYV